MNRKFNLILLFGVIVLVSAALLVVWPGNSPTQNAGMADSQSNQMPVPSEASTIPETPLPSPDGNRSGDSGNTAGQDNPQSSLKNENTTDPTALSQADRSGTAARSGSGKDRSDNDSDAESDETPRLSQRVFEVVSEVQTRQLEGQWEEALNEMNALYRDFDSLNPFEQMTLLNFYTNTLLQLEMYQESITAFSQMLTISDLPPAINERAVLALGQLHSRLGEPRQAIPYLESWLALTANSEGMEERTARVNVLLTQTQQALEP